MWPSSLRARLALWYTVLLALPLIAFAIVCYLFFAGAMLSRTDRFIGDALTAFSRELVAERRTAETTDRALQTTVEEVRFHDLHIVILDSSHRVVAATALAEGEGRADRRPSPHAEQGIITALQMGDPSAPFATTIDADGMPYRIVARSLPFSGQRYRLAGAYSLIDIEEMLGRIRRMFGLAIPLLVLSAAIGGYSLAKRSLSPVATMTTRAAAINAANLHERLPVSGGEELVGLSRVINDLLDRLEQAFEQQRRFMADASHELRTPTAILRTEIDVTLSREHRSEDEYRGSVAVMQSAARRLARIVDDLFLLARADSGHLVAQRENVYLEEVVHDAVRGVRHLADQRGVSVDVRRVVEAPFDGDADLLGRLILNLLDNAIKYSPQSGSVDVEMAQRDGRYIIGVVDSGPGISPELRDRVFERFFRADSVREHNESGATSGAGLGLAIARRIAELHGGCLELTESRPGRTEFRLTLPAASDGLRDGAQGV